MSQNWRHILHPLNAGKCGILFTSWDLNWKWLDTCLYSNFDLLQRSSNSLQLNMHGIQYVEELKILGITFNRSNEDLTTINIVSKLPTIEKEVLQWNRRHLSLIGKITVVKALLLSKLVHIFMALPNPSKNVIEQIEKVFFKFIWNNKNDRVKRKKMVQRQELDGLNMMYLHGFIKSMKISWMERLYKSDHSWVLVAQQNIPSIDDLRTYGSSKLRSLRNDICNPFWKDVIEAWTEFFELYKPNSHQIITEKLWFSDVSKFKNSIIKRWDTRGIRYVADLISNITGAIYSKNEIQTIYNVKMTFLCYASLIRSLPEIIKTTSYKSKITYPLIPYRISLMHGCAKISRLAYKEFQLSQKSGYRRAQTRLENKWIRDIGHFRLGSMKCLGDVTKNTYLQAFHFRLISRIIPTRDFLHKVGISNNSICTFCTSSVETLTHLFWDCEHTKIFITHIKQKLVQMFNTAYNVEKETWFFPNLDECSELEITITTIAKVTIYKAQLKNIPVSINHFLNLLKLEVEKEILAARINDNIDKFRTKWGRLESLAMSNNISTSNFGQMQTARRELLGARPPSTSI